MKGNRYNRIFGENPAADLLLDALKLERKDFGRYRDIFLNDQRNQILVFTRIGGQFRQYYRGHTRTLGMHDLIVNAFDDAFDTTYHYIVFRLPDDWTPELEQQVIDLQGTDKVKNVSQKFENLMTEAATMSEDQLRADPRFAEDFKMVERAALGNERVLTMMDDDIPKEMKRELRRQGWNGEA